MDETFTRTILFDCERMKYPHTGLYHFCLNLGRSLLETERNRNQLCFYVPPSAMSIFGKDKCYIKQHSLHKFIMPRAANVALWHCTYQDSRYIPHKKNMKILLTVHDLNFVYSKKSSDKTKKYLKALKARVERSDKIVAISQFTLRDLKKYVDLKDRPCEVIYNGCNIQELPFLQPPLILPQAQFLFTIGTITEKKNFHVLPCLLANNDMQLFIAGITQNDNYRAKIIEEAKKWGVEERVVFAGPISENDKQWYYKNCEAFLFPSISEGFGLPVIEAMYFGKPVVLSTATSLPEIGGKESNYFNSFDPDEMKQALATAFKGYSPEKAERIKKWAAQFSWSSSARQYSDVYAKLLS